MVFDSPVCVAAQNLAGWKEGEVKLGTTPEACTDEVHFQ